jgi:bifunctional UDP-N-acetylglucosamine pyrophosphorylase/glucosamine-1-phosphate N-acetyltransferase
MKTLNVVILAAGKGERMVSAKPKVMHEVMGKPMIWYVTERARELMPLNTAVVLGHGREEVESYLKGLDVHCTFQTEQKGTAHALLTADRFLAEGDTLVLYGDVPLIRHSTLEAFLDAYRETGAITFMVTRVDDPKGYGRVLLTGNEIDAIVEDLDATVTERQINLINTGICIIPEEYHHIIKRIDANNRKGEYYLTDICKIARAGGISVRAYEHGDAAEVLGVNSRKELLEANGTMRNRVLDFHMQNGVTLIDRSVFIEEGALIGRDTVIYPNAYIADGTSIGSNVFIGPNVIIKDCTIHDGVRIEGFSVLEGGDLREGVTIGPFSRIRPGTILKENVKIGNFVEVKNSVLAEGTKANHLSYIGDAEIGSKVNIGAGTITCNYDGKKKHRTIIEDNVFVGSNTEIVAPVTIGRNVIIGAGTTVTKSVPEDALAVSRAPQKHIEGYARRK